MANTISLTVGKTIYKLEFNRRTVAWMEDEGFVAEQIVDKPTKMITILFRGAMRMHHSNIKPTEADDIYLAITNKSGLIEKLLELYGTTVNSLIDDPEDNEGNAQWSLN